MGTAAHLGNVEILKMLLEPSPFSHSKNNFLNSSKKSRPSEGEVESWTGSSSSKPRRSRSFTLDRPSTKCNDMSTSKNHSSSLRRDSFSSDDEMPEMTAKDEDEFSSQGLQSPNEMLCGSESTVDRLGSKSREESNQGYFIVVHNDKEEETERPVSDDLSTEPITPDDMDNLEWDCELQTGRVDSPTVSFETTSWVGLYRLYADYLAKTCAVGMSVHRGTCRQIDVNQLDLYRRSAMHYAAEQGNLEVLQVLLSAGKVET